MSCASCSRIRTSSRFDRAASLAQRLVEQEADHHQRHAQLVVMLTDDAMGHSNMGVLGRLTPLARRQLLRRHVASEEQVDGHPFGAG